MISKHYQDILVSLHCQPLQPDLRHSLPLQDGNAGLVKQALAARQMRQTQRLTQTYLTLSLADIATHVGLPSPQEAEQHILRYSFPSPWPPKVRTGRTASLRCRNLCARSMHFALASTHSWHAQWYMMSAPGYEAPLSVKGLQPYAPIQKQSFKMGHA